MWRTVFEQLLKESDEIKPEPPAAIPAVDVPEGELPNEPPHDLPLEPKTAAERVLWVIADHYAKNAAARNQRPEVPFAVIRVGQACRTLLKQMKELSTQLASYVEAGRRDILEAVEQSRSREGGDLALLDLHHLCRNLADADKAHKDIYLRLIKNISTVLRVRPNTGLFGGLGIFHVPRRAELRAHSFANEVTPSAYKELAFDKATGWHKVAFDLY